MKLTIDLVCLVFAVFLDNAFTYGEEMTSSVKVIRTSTPCIATQTFLDDLKVMLLESEERQKLEAETGGTVYTRWGRNDCSSGSKLIYTGTAGGTPFNSKAGPATILCLPMQPEYANYTTGNNKRGYISGTEYETVNQLPGFNHLNDHDVPCAVCKTPRKRNTLMIPARTSCPQGWRQEYTGYLMGGHPGSAASEYICVDGEAEPLNYGHENKNGHLLYLVEGLCGSLPCPPYKQYWELACVVCSQ